MKQEMMGWQWRQLDHMQIICTSLKTDNHASTSPLSIYRLDTLPATKLDVIWGGEWGQSRDGCNPTNSVKAMKVSLVI